MKCAFFIVGTAVLLLSQHADATCLNPRAVCNATVSCLEDLRDQRRNDNDRIYGGVASRNGNTVWAGLDACQVDRGDKDSFDRNSGGCTDPEYVALAEQAMVRGCASLDRRTVWVCVIAHEKGFRELGRIGANEFCSASSLGVKGPCSCIDRSQGQVYLRKE